MRGTKALRDALVHGTGLARNDGMGVVGRTSKKDQRAEDDSSRSLITPFLLPIRFCPSLPGA